MDEPLKLRLANGALLDVPVYQKHKRGTNWCAIIDIDGTAPGGLSRRWLPKGKGACYYMTEGLTLFDPVEFGADYTTTTGNRHRDRWYGVIIAKTDDFLLIEAYKSGPAAILAAKDKRTSTEARKAALALERETLLERAKSLEEEIRGMDDACEKPAT